MNRRNPALSSHLKAVLWRGWGLGEHVGQGAPSWGWRPGRRCWFPDLGMDCGSDYPAAKCRTRPCPGYFYTGPQSVPQLSHVPIFVVFSSPC